jgi:hypothetical protein
MQEKNNEAGSNANENKASGASNTMTMDKAIETKNETYIISNLATYEGVLPKQTALDLITESGGGHPSKVLANLDKFADIDVNELVAHIISKGSAHAVVAKWDDLPGLDKEKTLNMLIANRDVPVEEDKFKKLANGKVGAFINRLAGEAGNGKAGPSFLKIVSGYAENGTLNTTVAKELIGEGFSQTAKYLIDKFDADAQAVVRAEVEK